MNTVQSLAVAAASLALGLFAGAPDQRLAPAAIGAAVTHLSYALPDAAQAYAGPLRLALAGWEDDGAFDGAPHKERRLRWAALIGLTSAPAYALTEVAVSACGARKRAEWEGAAAMDSTAPQDALEAASGELRTALPDRRIHLHARL